MIKNQFPKFHLFKDLPINNHPYALDLIFLLLQVSFVVCEKLDKQPVKFMCRENFSFILISMTKKKFTLMEKKSFLSRIKVLVTC